MSGRPLLARLDEVARLTGIPAYAEGKPRRRHVRALSTGALLAAVSGFVILVGSGAAVPFWRTYGMGYGLMIAGASLSNFMPLFGPVKPWGGSEGIDERDRVVRARAYLGALVALAATAILGLLGLTVWASLQGWPMGRLQSSMTMLAILLQSIFMAGPACFASWAEPPMIDED